MIYRHLRYRADSVAFLKWLRSNESPGRKVWSRQDEVRCPYTSGRNSRRWSWECCGIDCLEGVGSVWGTSWNIFAPPPCSPARLTVNRLKLVKLLVLNYSYVWWELRSIIISDMLWLACILCISCIHVDLINILISQTWWPNEQIIIKLTDISHTGTIIIEKQVLTGSDFSRNDLLTAD